MYYKKYIYNTCDAIKGYGIKLFCNGSTILQGPMIEISDKVLIESLEITSYEYFFFLIKKSRNVSVTYSHSTIKNSHTNI